MIYKVELRKMKVSFDNPVNYWLTCNDQMIDMNEKIGKRISLEIRGEIHCIACGKTIKKAYGQGFCYPCFMNSPLNSECIIRPELCQAHLGKGRDPKWENDNHNKPHIVYLALTSGVKVGVTRQDQAPIRWIDQGAWKSIILAETPYRQLAGFLEVYLKNHLTDKTSWQKMLKNEMAENLDLKEIKKSLMNMIPNDLRKYISDNWEIAIFNYPVSRYPEKIESINLLRDPMIEGKLTGIRGQYLMFDYRKVLNVRNHSGFVVNIEFE